MEFPVEDSKIHSQIYDLAQTLFPIQRSITGEGVRATLKILAEYLPGLNIVEVPSGTQVLDWVVPDEWNVRDAYVKDEQGNKIIDFKRHNISVVGYSTPVDKVVDLAELNDHLYSLEDQRDVIPYVTSYYQRRWGFCITHNERLKLKEGKYQVHIDSTLEQGSLTYGELILPGREEKEVLLSTYTCHPSLANDNLSGVIVTTYLARWLQAQENRRYTYRILFIPETIGALTYLSSHLDEMRARTAAGFVLTCVGDNRVYSFIPSRKGNTLADRVALNILESYFPGFIRYTFLDRGSDERQYCSPGVNLPVASITRSKYGAFPEYHTSLDNLDLISPEGLGGAYEIYRKCMYALENNYRYKTTVPGEPWLSKHGLMSSLSIKRSGIKAADLLNVWNYCDGEMDLVEISNTTGLPLLECDKIIQGFVVKGLVEFVQ